jgi:hypothetical protein
MPIPNSPRRERHAILNHWCATEKGGALPADIGRLLPAPCTDGELIINSHALPHAFVRPAVGTVINVITF